MMMFMRRRREARAREIQSAIYENAQRLAELRRLKHECPICERWKAEGGRR